MLCVQQPSTQPKFKSHIGRWGSPLVHRPGRALPGTLVELPGCACGRANLEEGHLGFREPGYPPHRRQVSFFWWGLGLTRWEPSLPGFWVHFSLKSLISLLLLTLEPGGRGSTTTLPQARWETFGHCSPGAQSQLFQAAASLPASPLTFASAALPFDF